MRADRKTDSSRWGAQPSDPSLHQHEQRGRVLSQGVCPALAGNGLQDTSKPWLPAPFLLACDHRGCRASAHQHAIIRHGAGREVLGRVPAPGVPKHPMAPAPSKNTRDERREQRTASQAAGRIALQWRKAELAPECVCNRVYASLGQNGFILFEIFRTRAGDQLDILPRARGWRPCTD